MDTNTSTEPLGIAFHTRTHFVHHLPEAVTDLGAGSPFTVIDFGDIRMHINSADDARRLLQVLQNAIVRQEMAEAKFERETSR